MSEADATVVREVYEAYNRGEYERATAMLHDDAELHQPPEVPGGGSWVGREGFARGIALWVSGFEPGFQFRIVETVDAPDRVMMRVSFEGRGRTSGVELKHDWFNVWEVRDGKPFRCVIVEGEGEAREAAGLPPP